MSNLELQIESYLGNRVTKLENRIDELTVEVNKNKTDIKVIGAKIAIAASIAGAVAAALVQWYLVGV